VRPAAFAALLTREWRTSWADATAYGLRTAYGAVLLLGAIAAWLALPIFYSGKSESYPELIRAIFDTFCRAQFGLATLFATMTFARAVCREQERGTMDLLILSPLSRTEILAGKLTGEFLGVTALVASGVPILFLLIPLGGISAVQILTLQTTLLAHVLVVGGICVALAAVIGRTFPVMVVAWIVVTLLSGGLWAAQWLFPKSYTLWYLWEYLSIYAILDGQLNQIVPQPLVSLKALGLAAITSLLLCGLGSLMLERRHLAGRRVGPFAAAAIRIRRFALTARGLPLFRHLFPIHHPLVRRELAVDRDVPFRVAWILLVAVYAAAFRIILTWRWRGGEYHFMLAGIALAIGATIAAVIGAYTVGAERRRGALQALLVCGMSAEEIIRSRMAGLLLRTVALVALPAAHLIWIGSYMHAFPASELPWRIPIAIVAVLVGVVVIAQTSLQAALSVRRPELGAIVAIFGVIAAIGVVAFTGATRGTFILAVPASISGAVAFHVRLIRQTPKWVLA
jgi:ABC-type transport system involved in multi-copper enzyme maturation permease subunit